MCAKGRAVLEANGASRDPRAVHESQGRRSLLPRAGGETGRGARQDLCAERDWAVGPWDRKQRACLASWPAAGSWRGGECLSLAWGPPQGSGAPALLPEPGRLWCPKRGLQASSGAERRRAAPNSLQPKTRQQAA